MNNSNHTIISQTLAKDVLLNLGGGGNALVNVHLNEEGFLLIEGLGLETVSYQIYVHDKNLLEVQIMFYENEEEEY